jgi:hypothetical protein
MTRLESPEEASARLESETLTEVERTELWERIRARTAESAGVRRPTRVVALAALACCAVVFAVFAFRHGHSSSSPRGAPAGCALDGSGDHITLPLSCPAATVRVGGDEWLVTGGAEVARFDGGARLLRGTVQFHVEHRTDTHFYVQVSHGEVRVVGTRFEVRQTSDGGSVSVSEGTIEFVWLDGSKERVSVGQTLLWPKRAERVESAAPVPAASAPASAPDIALRRPAHDAGSKASHPESAGDETDLEHLMDRLLQLKSQHRFPEVVTLLTTTLATQKLGGVQRERLSYELGIALEASGRSACAHWKRHVQRFGSGAHAAALDVRLKKCDGT